MAKHTLLLHQPVVLVYDVTVLGRREVELGHQHGDQLIDLQQTNVFTDASTRTSTKLGQC